ncbi:hypothetical protein quinque_000523 [Culex quinquefasciatus]
MAFMMPVMKNEFDIYKGRQRRVSECSNQSNCRSRKVSESSRSDCPSLSTSPGNEFMAAGSPARHRSHPMYMSHLASRPQFSRSASRNSQSSLVTSPTKAASASSSSPPKPATGSQSSLSSFHTRLVDKLRKSTEPPDADTDQQQDDGDGGVDDDEAELVLSDSVLHVTSKPPLPHRSSTTPFRTNSSNGSGRHRSRRGTLSAPR